MNIINSEIIQGTPEWFSEKAGCPSSSNMSKIITTTGKVSSQRKGYLFELAAERITGEPTQTFQSDVMSEGIRREQESRGLYELIHGVAVEQVGMIYPDENKRFLCSPDGLVNREYGLELKNVLPKTQAKYLYNDKLPTEYFIQVQASLFISGYDRWDFCSYSPGLPPLIIKVERDEAFIQKLSEELYKFCKELDEIERKLKLKL